ncbi:MAG: hypothetical protein R3D29_12325 [Nitratireductor sp.]
MREPHPFTVAGLGKDGFRTFRGRAAGRLHGAFARKEAAVRDRILVEGGYGRFVHSRGGDKQIWLAGGIGITPFLAMAESLTPEEKRQIHLVHCVRDSAEAVREEALREASDRVSGFVFIFMIQRRRGASTLRNCKQACHSRWTGRNSGSAGRRRCAMRLSAV